MTRLVLTEQQGKEMIDQYLGKIDGKESSIDDHEVETDLILESAGGVMNIEMKDPTTRHLHVIQTTEIGKMKEVCIIYHTNSIQIISYGLKFLCILF